MTKEPQEKKDRNKELARDYKTGMSMVELVTKYQITPQRIYKIILSNKKKHEFGKKR